jgi:hypothetical protein
VPAPTLPTFFIIGAAKAGTTSLHAYLSGHPEIAMTTVKEPGIFEPDRWRERLPQYAALFPRAAAVRGESSTAYSGYPYAPWVPEAVRSVVPDARIIYLVRDPIERSIAHYVQHRYAGQRLPPFGELIADVDNPLNSVLWCSRYATQLARWSDWFAADRIRVLDQRMLLSDRSAVVTEVLQFLGVSSDVSQLDLATEHNPTAAHRELRPRVRDRRGSGRLASWPVTRQLVTRPVPRPVVTTADRAHLADLFGPEAAEFRKLTGLAFSDWSV